MHTYSVTMSFKFDMKRQTSLKFYFGCGVVDLRYEDEGKARAGGKLAVLDKVLSNFLASCSRRSASKEGSWDTVLKESPKACRSCCISRPAFVLLKTYCCLRFISWLSCSLNKVTWKWKIYNNTMIRLWRQKPVNK